MAGVTISPNIQKQSTRIDANGNVLDPRTKQIIAPAEQPYIPTAEERAAAERTATEPPRVEAQKDAKENPLAQAIKKQVQDAVKKELEAIDISSMVAEAVKDAFK